MERKASAVWKGGLKDGQGTVSSASGILSGAAARLKVTTSQLALAWLLWRSPVILPIPGTSRVEHLEENIAAASLKLDENTLREIGESVRAA